MDFIIYITEYLMLLKQDQDSVWGRWSEVKQICANLEYLGIVYKGWDQESSVNECHAFSNFVQRPNEWTNSLISPELLSCWLYRTRGEMVFHLTQLMKNVPFPLSVLGANTYRSLFGQYSLISICIY